MTHEIDKLTNKLKLVPQSWYAWQMIPGLGGVRGDNLNCFFIDPLVLGERVGGIAPEYASKR